MTGRGRRSPAAAAPHTIRHHNSTPRGGTVMELQGKRAAILVEQQYQELEVWYPLYRLREAGCRVDLVGHEAGKAYPSKLGYPATRDVAANSAKPADYDALIIPGGFAPDFIRRHESMLKFTR